ncbi:enoyl-(Acyl carrier protein) reductase domain-containing protein [Sarocladium implicatum]|nr:enoyl-(Acyl carrier protein) reductase domain-containing protein [Sarocladium implicatum]
MAADPVVLVTAGSAGLGRAAAVVFANNGYRVVINYSNNKTRADELLAELEATTSGSHIVIQADLSLRSEVDRLVKETVQATGRIDVIFSNVGWSQFRDTSRLEDNAFDEDWDKAYTMNVKTHMWLLRAAESHLAETEGAFISTASVAGVSGTGSALAYGASKAAQIHMMKALATMVGPKIRVNTISPGLLETEWALRFTDEQKAQHKAQTRLKRFVRVEDAAEQVLSLAKNRSITGINVVIDAGFVR